MIKIKMHEHKWRIEIENEEWEIEDRKKFDETLKKLLDMKGEFGKIR